MKRIVLKGGRIFDGTGSALAEADVVIEEAIIVEVGTDLDGDQAVDLSGHSVLPGLFDCHVHLTISTIDVVESLQTPFSLNFYEAARNLALTLSAGVTTVRDAGGADLGIKRAVERGYIPGPRMRISVSILSQTGGHGDGWMPSGSCVPLLEAHPGRPAGVVDGLEGLRQRVREVLRAGADQIKVCASGGVLSSRDDPRHAQFQPDELAVAVAEATRVGSYVMAHAAASEGTKNAIRAGIRSIEHGIFLDDECIDLMLRHGTWLVPTLMAPQAVIDASAKGASLPDAVIAKARDVVESHRDSFRRAVMAGVKVAMGTDSGVGPHGSNLHELQLMAAGGMSGERVLHAATCSAAELLQIRDEVGTIEPGKVADLVVVEGDPFDFATLPDRVRSVWQAGKLVNPAPMHV